MGNSYKTVDSEGETDMTLIEILKSQGLSDEQIALITKGMVDNKIFNKKKKKIEERYEKVKLERDDLKGKLTTADTTITDLKKNNTDNVALQKTITDHEDTIKTMKTDYDTKIREMSINTAIQSKLTDTKYADLLTSKFDRTKLSVTEDGTVLGIDDQLTVIKETYKDLFTPTVTGKTPNNQGGSQPLKGRRQELETIINDPKTKFVDRIAARNQLVGLTESEE